MPADQVETGVRTVDPDNKVKLRFCVRDTGIGIPEAQLEDLF